MKCNVVRLYNLKQKFVSKENTSGEDIDYFLLRSLDRQGDAGLVSCYGPSQWEKHANFARLSQNAKVKITKQLQHDPKKVQ